MPLPELMDALVHSKEFLLGRLKQEGTVKFGDTVKYEDKKENPLNEGYNHLLETKFTSGVFKKSVHIYSHLDSDGISSAAILARTFERAKIGFQITILNQLETQYIEDIKKEIESFNKFIIFADFGSGQTNILEKQIPADDYLILDHHSPHESSPSPTLNHINPYYYGIDGSYQISGAGICYLFAKTMDPNNSDLAHIAIIGALGDTQNQNSNRGEFQSPNKEILDEAIKAGKIELVTDIAISRSRPLTQALAYNLPISIPGISNNENQAKIFLEKNNIRVMNDLNEPRTLLDLNQIEKKSLSKALIQFALVSAGLEASFTNKLISTFYLLKQYDSRSPVSDARELSSLLNACGRSGHPSLGILLLLGDKDALEEAIRENKSHRKNIAAGIQWAESHLVQHENIVSVYGGDITDEKIIGTIASMLIHSGKNITKPIIAYADSDNNTFKVSARAPNALIDGGLDLGAIMRKVCTDLGFENPAGGHRPAAGAKIPRNKLKEFLNAVDIAVKESQKAAK